MNKICFKVRQSYYFVWRRIELKKRKWLAVFLLICISFVANLETIVRAEEKGTEILYENGIHYIIDPQYPGHKIPLFCMNNKLHWPHHTEDMGDLQVPGYAEGYLTPNDFDSKEDYEECMRRLSKLLYAGYPYNGERLYQIVENSTQYTPTEAEFNNMLIVPPVLQTAYPYLGHHSFTYDDWKNDNKTHLEDLRKFVNEVFWLFKNGGTTQNGLTYEDIASMPFYKAAFSITNCNDSTPLETFQYFYGASYFVTEEEAYNATQSAVWYLLKEYGIPDNDINNMSLPLSNVLYKYSEHGGLLNYKPNLSDIKLSGDLTFRYNPKDGMWHSSPLTFIEPDEYRGLYRLILPEGMKALCDNLSYVYGNEQYELVSDHQPTEGETFGIEAEFVWLEEFKQYSPSPDIEFEGKKFQHMIGAIIHTEVLSTQIPVSSVNVGEVSVTKKLIGENGADKEFQFEFKLPYHQGINGAYGDLEFNKGVAIFTLKAGETKTARYLPSGAQYVIRELNADGYLVDSVNSEGQVPVHDIQTATFTNTCLFDLTISKVVEGSLGDRTKEFTFDIEAKDSNGILLNGDYNYIGSIKQGYEGQSQIPQNGILAFKDGHAQVKLKHGQQITIKNLAVNTEIKVTEVEEEGYITSYVVNGQPQDDGRLILAESSTVDVVNQKKEIPNTKVTNHTEGNHWGLGVAAVAGLSFSALYLLRLKKERQK